MSCQNCGKALQGVVGLVKAAAGIDRADDETIRARLLTCAGCPQLERNPLLHLPPGASGVSPASRCRACGCFVAAKARLASESCPEGRWLPPQTPPGERESGDGP